MINHVQRTHHSNTIEHKTKTVTSGRNVIFICVQYMNGKVLWCLMASVCVAQQQNANSVQCAYQHGPGSIHSLIFVHAPELVSQRCDAVWHNLWPRFPLKNQHKLGDFVRSQDTRQARPVSVSFWASDNTVDIKTSHCNYTDHRYLLALQLYIYLQKSRYKCTAHDVLAEYRFCRNSVT